MATKKKLIGSLAVNTPSESFLTSISDPSTYELILSNTHMVSNTRILSNTQVSNAKKKGNRITSRQHAVRILPDIYLGPVHSLDGVGEVFREGREGEHVEHEVLLHERGYFEHVAVGQCFCVELKEKVSITQEYIF